MAVWSEFVNLESKQPAYAEKRCVRAARVDQVQIPHAGPGRAHFFRQIREARLKFPGCHADLKGMNPKKELCRASYHQGVVKCSTLPLTPSSLPSAPIESTV